MKYTGKFYFILFFLRFMPCLLRVAIHYVLHQIMWKRGALVCELAYLFFHLYKEWGCIYIVWILKQEDTKVRAGGLDYVMFVMLNKLKTSFILFFNVLNMYYDLRKKYKSEYYFIILSLQDYLNYFSCWLQLTYLHCMILLNII